MIGTRLTKELIPEFDSRKSFYKKAYIHQELDKGVIKLQSYNTIVATISKDQLTIHGDYSQTTMRHIKEFALQFGFEVGSKQEMLKWYSDK